MIQAEQLIGTWRRFGSSGLLYEIVHAGVTSPDGDRMMRVRVVESGEEVDYKLTDIPDGPKER